MPHTPLVCPSSLRTSRPLATSHRRTVLSLDPEASRRPSGEKWTPHTAAVCPSSLLTSRPLATSHRRTVLSPVPDASRQPSPGEKDTLHIDSVCPVRMRGCLDGGVTSPSSRARSRRISKDRDMLSPPYGVTSPQPLSETERGYFG